MQKKDRASKFRGEELLCMGGLLLHEQWNIQQAGVDDDGSSRAAKVHPSQYDSVGQAVRT